MSKSIVYSKSAMLYDPLLMKIENKIIRNIKPNEVLIKIMAVGICGSDIHYYKKGKIGNKAISTPLILGHECSGIVVDIGENVQTLKIGDRVAIEPGDYCKTCEYCLRGKYNLCDNVRYLSSPPINGALTEFLIHPAHLVYQIPKN